MGTNSFRCRVVFSTKDLDKHKQFLKGSGDDEAYVDCHGIVLCGLVIKTASSNLNKHIAMHRSHRAVFKGVIAALESKKRARDNEVFSDRLGTQKKLRGFMKPDISVRERLIISAANFFALNSMPHLITHPDNHSLHIMLEDYHSARLKLGQYLGPLKPLFPTPYEVRKAQVMHAETLTDQVMKELRCASVSHVVTLAIDGWKNISRRHLQNVIALCNGRAFYIGSFY
jgi:hypothetical protein